MNPLTKGEVERWYDQQAHALKAGTAAVEQLLKEILKAKGLAVVAVTSRTKGRESFLEKAFSRRKTASGPGKRRYKDPISEITDLCGLRIVTFFERDTQAVDALVRENFEVDPNHTVDKRVQLGTKEVGYRSIHYIVKLSARRAELVEYSTLKDRVFEIQVRSILQHAWAEIEHDRRFKPGRVGLPDHLARRFSLLAGALELIDLQFDALAADIDELPKQEANFSLEELETFLKKRFKTQITSRLLDPRFGPKNEAGDVALDELAKMGVRTFADLERVFPEKSKQARHPIRFVLEERTNFLGLVRDALLILDARRFLRDAHQDRWGGYSASLVKALDEAGVGSSVLDEAGLYLEDDGFDPDDYE